MNESTATTLQRDPRPSYDRVASLVTEYGEEYRVVQQRNPEKTFGRAFIVTFDETAEKLALTINSAATLKVLLLLPKLLSYDAWKRLNQVTLGARLGLAHSSISRSLAELVELDVIDRRGKGPVVEWKLTPEYSWRGYVETYHKAKRDRKVEADIAPTRVESAVAAEDILKKNRQRPLRLHVAVNNRPSRVSSAS